MKRYPVTDALLLTLIILVGAVLRFYDYAGLPYSYDEFSALFRTRFDHFRDLIHYGVVTSDTHPAGIQVFLYYWVKVAGESEMWVKLPFLLAGLGSIYLAYRIAASWFNSSAGLITAMMVSFLQYAVTYSQYARPYISGLFFSLLFVWSLHNAFLNRAARWRTHTVMYILAGAACAYNHHFSLFFIGLAGATSILFVPRGSMLRYLGANALIFTLYIPHLGIFFTQLGKGGVESWLRKPEPGFFLDYLAYLMHHHVVMFAAAILLFLLSAPFLKTTIRRGNKYRILMILWVGITWATAYYYSIYRNAVLQFSVLLFTFPFLVMLVYSLTGDLRRWLKVTVVIVFGILSIYTLVFSRQHYRIQYQSVLEQTIAEMSEARHAYGTGNVVCATNISSKVQDFYASRYDMDPSAIVTIDTSDRFIAFRKELEASPAGYLAIGWVNIPYLEVLSVAREVFPVMVKKRSYYTGDFYLLAREPRPADTLIPDDVVMDLRIDSLTIYHNAVSRGQPLIFDHGRLRMPGWQGFVTFYEGRLGGVAADRDNYLLVSMEVENPIPDYRSQLILEVTRGDSLLYWVSRSFNEFTDSDWGRYRIHVAVKLADLDLDLGQDVLKVYLANIDEAYYYINYFRITATEGNPVLYGLFEKIQD